MGALGITRLIFMSDFNDKVVNKISENISDVGTFGLRIGRKLFNFTEENKLTVAKTLFHTSYQASFHFNKSRRFKKIKSF